MAETIKKGIIKKKTDANNTVILYPKTTADQVEYESKTFTLANLSSLPSQSDYFFAELIPDDLEKAYSATIDILVENDGIIVADNSAMWLHSYKCIFSSESYWIDETKTNSVPAPDLIANQWINGYLKTGSGSYYFKMVAMRPLRGTEYRSAINSGHGHIFGLRNGPNITFTTSGNINITIKVYNTTNCKIKFLNDVSIVAANLDLTLNGYTYNKGGRTWLNSYYGNQLYADSIENAWNSVSVYNTTSTSTTFYLASAWGSPNNSKTNLYGNNQLYYRYNDGLYSNGSNGFITNNTQYNSNAIVKNGTTLNLPSKAGTIALTSDISNIIIDDLTEINN